MIIKQINIKDLKAAEYNPRQATKEQEQHLKASLEQFGVVEPIVVNQNKDRFNVIVGGHFRTRELKKLGHKEVDCVIVDLPIEKERELNIRLNANTGDFDFDLLANNFELEDLQEWGLDVPELNIEVLEPEETEGDDDVLESAPAITKKGDLYELGEHRILCGDSTMIDDVEKVMGGKKADMVFTDPPYNTGMRAKSNSGSTWLNHMFNDSFTDVEWEKLLTDFTNNYFIFSKDDSVCYICLDWRRSHELVPKAKNAGFRFSNLIVWDKMVHGLGSDYKYTHEFIHVLKKGSPELNTHQGEQEYQDVWHIQRKMGKDEEHATKKPIELCTRAINHASKKDNLVLDLFLGSGSTLIACEKTDRKCYGMELEPRYCDVIVKRYIDFCKKNNKPYSVKKNGKDFLKEYLQLTEKTNE